MDRRYDKEKRASPNKPKHGIHVVQRIVTSIQQHEKEKEKMTLTSQKEQQEGRLPIIEIIVTQ